MQISSERHGEIASSALVAGERRSVPKEAENTAGSSVPNDSVSVSQDARLMMEASKTAQQTPDVRRERVEALRIQVQNGTYQPDSQLIAHNLVHEEPGLFMF